jgi:glycosyltransferase involved in cell wall biosynthesis
MSKVAIIIPVYNTAEKILKRAFDSCINQSYTDFEIIVVNDGSTSSITNKTLDFYHKNYKQLFKVHKIENIGASLARKYGLNKCSSEFVFFLDADDYIEEYALQKIVETQVATQSDVVVGQFYLVDDSTKVDGTNYQLIDESNTVIKSFLSSKLPITLWPNLYRKSI